MPTKRTSQPIDDGELVRSAVQANDVPRARNHDSDGCRIKAPMRLGADGPWVSGSSDPVVQLSGRRIRVYKALMEAQRCIGYASALSAGQIWQILVENGEHHSMIFSFDKKIGLTRRIKDNSTSRDNRFSRFIVFAPYRLNSQGVVMVPEECRVDKAVTTPDGVVPQPEANSKESAGNTVRSKAQLEDEIKRLLSQADECAKQTHARRLAELEDRVREQRENVLWLRHQLAEAENRLGVLEVESELHRLPTPEVAIDTQTLDRINRLKAIIENYDLLYEA